MSLVKNTAAELAKLDEGLATGKDASHVKEALAVAGGEWPETKQAIDEMSESDLESFVDSLEGIPLQKTGYIRIRLTPKEYAELKLKAVKNGTTVTNVITN